MKLNDFVVEVHEAARQKGWWNDNSEKIEHLLRANIKASDFDIETAMRKFSEEGLNQARSPLDIHALIISEISEATEEVRKATPPVYVINHAGVVVELDSLDFISLVVIDNDQHRYLKPEGHAIELADAVIRICDYFGYRGWDMEAILKLKFEYNKTRSHRHGGKAY